MKSFKHNNKNNFLAGWYIDKKICSEMIKYFDITKETPAGIIHEGSSGGPEGDFLIDQCEIDLPGPVEKVCPDCKINPKALVENWRTSINSPFLNERLFLYQVGIQTPYTETGGTDSALEEKFEEFKAEAIDLFLTEYDKEYTSAAFLILEK